MNRRTLAPRRPTASITVRWLGQRFAVSFGRFPDGKPAEVFIAGAKPANDMQALASDAALLLSLALQYGAPLEVISNAVGREEGGTPQSIIGIVADAFVNEVAEVPFQ